MQIILLRMYLSDPELGNQWIYPVNDFSQLGHWNPRACVVNADKVVDGGLGLQVSVVPNLIGSLRGGRGSFLDVSTPPGVLPPLL
jgi:hypothetical protein